MSIKEVPSYTVICDRCKVSADENGEYAFWGEISSARDSATDAEWLQTDTEDICTACTKGWIICVECQQEGAPTDEAARASGWKLDATADEWFGPKCVPAVEADGQEPLEVQQ